MKILSPKQLYTADKATLKKQGITSWQLMERASIRAFEKIVNLITKKDSIGILVGMGNNAGDGLAIAYHLINAGYLVEVIIFKYTEKFSGDCEKNFNRLQNKTAIKIKTLPASDESFSNYTVFIDAIFGIGLNRELPDFVKASLKIINNTKTLKIAIDVPSGLYLASLTPNDSVVFKADYTLTFHCPKLNFFLPHFGNYVGIVQVIDIGIDKAILEQTRSSNIFTTKALVKSYLKSRQRFTHKGTFGHVLLVGGQKGMLGCMVLSTKSAMRSGVGKATAIVPESGVAVLQSAVPEAMCIASENENVISKVSLPFTPTTIGIGMGMGQSTQAKDTLEYFLEYAKSPMLIDADGLNIISTHKELLSKIPSKSILTPHKGELERLIGSWDNDYDKIKKIKAFSSLYNVVVVSKDAYTFVVYGDDLYVNSTGNPGMATAGSGDVLSGLIAGLMAQGYTPLYAAIVGVYIHGLSADIYASKYDQNTLIASDLIENFKDAFSLLKK